MAHREVKETASHYQALPPHEAVSGRALPYNLGRGSWESCCLAKRAAARERGEAGLKAPRGSCHSGSGHDFGGAHLSYWLGGLEQVMLVHRPFLAGLLERLEIITHTHTHGPGREKALSKGQPLRVCPRPSPNMATLKRSRQKISHLKLTGDCQMPLLKKDQCPTALSRPLAED